MIRSLRRRRGFTLLELTIVMALSVVFAALVAQALQGLNRAAVDITDRAVSQDQARQGMDLAAQALRGARPLGACEVTEEDTTIYVYRPLKTCITPREAPFRLLYASPTSVSFYAYNTTTESTPAALTTIPDLVTISLEREDSCRVVMTRRPALEPNNLTDVSGLTPPVSYTYPHWKSVAESGTDRPVITLGTVSATSRDLGFFRYLDQNGELLDPVVSSPGEDPTLVGSVAPSTERMGPPRGDFGPLSTQLSEARSELDTVFKVSTIEFAPVFTGDAVTDENGCSTETGDGADFALTTFADIASVRYRGENP